MRRRALIWHWRDSFLRRLRRVSSRVGGLSGTGKSAVARAIAPVIGAFPGAVIVRSDVERKRLCGVAPSERLPASAYAPEISDRVYAMCRKRALMALEGGQSVIVDAVHAKKDERDALVALAAKMRVPFTGLWLEAPEQVMRERVAARTGDVSDATPEVVEEQLGYDIGPQTFAVVDASRPIEQVAASCLARIGVKPPAAQVDSLFTNPLWPTVRRGAGCVDLAAKQGRSGACF